MLIICIQFPRPDIHPEINIQRLFLQHRMTIKHTASLTWLTTKWGLSEAKARLHTRQKSLTRKSLDTCYKVRRNLMSPLISDFFTRLFKKNVKVDIDGYWRQNALIIQHISTCSIYWCKFTENGKKTELFYNLSKNEFMNWERFTLNGCWSIRCVAHILWWVHRVPPELI